MQNYLYRHRLSWIASITLAMFVALGFLGGTSHAAKDTPFGVQFIAANTPNSTLEEVNFAFNLSAAIGSHSSFVWHWDDRVFLGLLPSLATMAQQRGLKTLFQIGATLAGEPAPPGKLPKSFGDPEVRKVYLEDTATLASLRPDYLVLCTEVNLMYRFNPAEFNHYITLYREAYDLVKSISPETKVGTSLLHFLWFANYRDNIDVAELLGPRDFVAFTSYPDSLVRDGFFASIADIPAEWYGYVRTAYPNDQILFTEVAWPSKGHETPAQQAEYVRNLPRLMSIAKPEIVTWSLLYDVVFFQPSLLSEEAARYIASLGVNVEDLFIRMNGMGLLDTSGYAKPALLEAINLDFSKP